MYGTIARFHLRPGSEERLKEQLREIQAAQVAPSLPPLLVVSAQTSNVALSWESAASLQLQSRTNLGIGSWSSVTNDPAVSGNVHTVTLPASQESEFFRLSP